MHLDTLAAIAVPALNVDLRAQALEGAQIIDPQTHRPPRVRPPVAGRQAPGHADVAKIVDHGAKNILQRGFSLSGIPGSRCAEAPIVRINYPVQKSRRRLIFMRQSPLACDHSPGGNTPNIQPRADPLPIQPQRLQLTGSIALGVSGWGSSPSALTCWLASRLLFSEQLAPGGGKRWSNWPSRRWWYQPVPDIPPQSPLFEQYEENRLRRTEQQQTDQARQQLRNLSNPNASSGCNSRTAPSAKKPRQRPAILRLIMNKHNRPPTDYRQAADRSRYRRACARKPLTKRRTHEEKHRREQVRHPGAGGVLSGSRAGQAGGGNSGSH